MSVFGQLASLLVRPEKDAGFEDTFASRFGAAPLDAAEAAALRQRQFTNRQQASGAERAERAGPAVLGGLADLSKSLGEPVTRIADYSRSRVGTEAPLTEEDVFRQDLASRNIGKGIAQAGAYGLPVKNPLAAVPARAELRGGALYANTPKTTPTVVQGIRAYHGSPHDFDKFDLSKIGTGEGAQAYGHGLYFAENEGVARSYRDVLAKQRNLDASHGGFDTESLKLINQHGGVEQARAALDGVLAGMDPKATAYGYYKNMRNSLREPDRGKMYEVSLNARPEQFLDWDRPLREQPQAVRQALPQINVPGVPLVQRLEGGPQQFGHDVYRTLEQSLPGANTRMGAASALREAGIPGVRYLDQGSRPHLDAYQAELKKYQGLVEESRNKLKADPNNPSLRDELIKTRNELNRIERVGPGTSNYVVFDPGIIDILRKYGLAGATAAPLGALAAQDNYRP